MARIFKNPQQPQQTGLTGSNVVDIFDYDEGVHDYLLARGAVESTVGYIGDWPKHKHKFECLQFSGCKPVRHSVDAARIFFASTDEAKLFLLVFGHKIRSSYVKEVQQLVNSGRELADKY